MFGYKAAIFGGLLCSLILTIGTNAFDVTNKRVEHVTLTDKDIVPKEQLVITLRSAHYGSLYYNSSIWICTIDGIY
jgi:hypothetical protein